MSVPPQDLSHDEQWLLFAVYVLADGKPGVVIEKEALHQYLNTHTFEETRDAMMEIRKKNRH
jgi:hypothetical protein